MDLIILDLPWPPSVNHYKITGRSYITKSGKFYQPRINSHKTKVYYEESMAMIAKQMPAEWIKIGLDKEVKFEVTIFLYPRKNYRYDIDNRLKVILDSLMKGKVIADDSQIYKLHVSKMYPNRPHGFTQVIVEKLNID